MPSFYIDGDKYSPSIEDMMFTVADRLSCVREIWDMSMDELSFWYEKTVEAFKQESKQLDSVKR